MWVRSIMVTRPMLRVLYPQAASSEEQKAIYQIVYDAQEEVFKMCKAGVPYASLEEKTGEVLAAGLIKLGIIKDAKELRTYYPHGVSHHMGLDVHDKGSYAGNLEENMVITVEPGIYIPAGSKCDKKWWNIGVRIEDDIVLGKDKGTNLSIDAQENGRMLKKWPQKKVYLTVRNSRRLNRINYYIRKPRCKLGLSCFIEMDVSLSLSKT
jgi:Xaa-Pro aminopeptidase